MAENQTNSSDITELSPDSLLTTFTKKSLTQFLLIAVVIHIIVIGVTSLGTFKALAMGEAPEESVEETVEDATEAANTTGGAQQTATGNQATGNQNGNAQANGEQPADGEPEEGNAYVEQLRETASPDEIPTDSDLGISVEDTSF